MNGPEINGSAASTGDEPGEDFEAPDMRVMGVLTGQVRAVTPWPECRAHKEVQHRDAKPPWCDRCGWNRGRTAVEPAKVGEPRTGGWGTPSGPSGQGGAA